nr:class I SAM-dependent methyltransferase [Nocardia suismassiliense]
MGAGSALGAQMFIHRPREFFLRLGNYGLIGLGESYMAGEWTSPDLVGLLTVFAADMSTLVPAPLQRFRSAYVTKPPVHEYGSEATASENVSRHYDLSNDMFELFLDRTLTYSGALFLDPSRASWDELPDAQSRKIDRLLDLAHVGSGTELLEIGSGWGELCIRAAARGATVRSVTLSREQLSLARHRIAYAGHQSSVQLDLLDYRAVEGTYDAIVSAEMIEAVGFRYWETYFTKLESLLAPGGKIALQAITMPHERMLATRGTHTWIQKYIFPGGSVPSVTAIEQLTKSKTSLDIIDRLDFGAHYAETLRLWRERFCARSDVLQTLGFDRTFRRMWNFYLAYCEAGFRSRYLDVQQFALQHRGRR